MRTGTKRGKRTSSVKSIRLPDGTIRVVVTGFVKGHYMDKAIDLGTMQRNHVASSKDFKAAKRNLAKANEWLTRAKRDYEAARDALDEATRNILNND